MLKPEASTSFQTASGWPGRGVAGSQFMNDSVDGERGMVSIVKLGVRPGVGRWREGRFQKLK